MTRPLTDAERMADAGLVPITLADDDRGCAGFVRPVSNAMAGICILCTRRGKPAPLVTPSVARGSRGELYCPERRSAGVPAGLVPETAGSGCVHAPQDGTHSRGCSPLVLGVTPIGANASDVGTSSEVGMA